MSATIAATEASAAEAAAPAEASSFARDLANLDFMRAVAVLLVVGDHVFETTGALLGRDYNPIDWYSGRMGVLMFFVHTSLVLMLSMDRSRASGVAFFSSFYVRRAFRIYPLSIVCVLLVLLMGSPPQAWTSQLPQPYSAYDIAANLLLVQNLLSVRLVLTPLWSLPLELQMYGVLPVLYVMLRAAGASGPVRRAWMLWTLAIVTAIVQPLVPGLGRLNVATFGPCFLAGVLAYTLLPRTRPAFPAWAWCTFLFAVCAAYIGVALASTSIHPPWLGWAYCLVIGLAIPRFHQLRGRRIRAASHAVAKYSYGVYLFHMLALWVGVGPTSPLALDPVTGSVVTLAVLVAAPVLSYHLIEQPMINVGTRVAGRLARA